MKRQYLIYAASCVLCLLSSCNEQMMVEENQQLSSSPVTLKSANWNGDYYMCLEKLAFTFYETFQASEEFRELVINKFASTGRKNLLIQELIGYNEWDTRIGHLWADNPCGEFVVDITQMYPNIRLTIVDDIEEIYDYIPSSTPSVTSSDGGEAAAPVDENAYIAVGYKFVGTSLDEPMPAYTRQSGDEITDVYNYNDFPIIIEGGSEYSDEVIWENIRFEGQGYAGGQNDWVTIIKLEGGRPKYNCTKGFGICHAWIFGWQAWNQVPVDDYSISIGIDDVVNVAELETVTLELAEMPSIDLANAWLPVEEEIVVLVDEAEFDPIDKLVPIQQCVFDPSIGEYGGFELQLENF